MSAADRRWLTRQALGLALAALLLLAAFENTALDVALSRQFFDAAAQRFPWQHHWLLADVLHHGLKTASFVLAIPALTLCWFGSRGRLAWLPPGNARLAGIGMALIPLLTMALKQLTNRHCPWDVIEFGGYAPYVSLFATTPPDLARGACFPAGHASGGFVWLIWALALFNTRPAAARRILAGALAAGAVMGLARIVQGAHFVSHVLWSAWLAWAVGIALAAWLRVPLAGKAPVARGSPAVARIQGI